MQLAAGAEILALFQLFCLFLVSYMIFRWLVQTFVSRIPFVGGRIASAAIAIGDAMESRLERWLHTSVHTLVSWFSVLASRITSFPDAVRDALWDVANALDHLVKVKIHQIVNLLLNPVRDALTAIRGRLTDAENTLDGIPALIERRLSSMKDAIIHTVTQQWQAGIDRLYRDVVEPEIVGIEHGIRDLSDGLDAARTEARQAVGAVAQRVADLAQRLDIPVSLIEQLIAAVGIAAAIEALETLATCRGKLKTLCTSDPSQWADFIAGIALVLAWPGLVEMTQFAQEFIEPEVSFLTDLAVNGVTL